MGEMYAMELLSARERVRGVSDCHYGQHLSEKIYFRLLPSYYPVAAVEGGARGRVGHGERSFGREIMRDSYWIYSPSYGVICACKNPLSERHSHGR